MPSSIINSLRGNVLVWCAFDLKQRQSPHFNLFIRNTIQNTTAILEKTALQWNMDYVIRS